MWSDSSVLFYKTHFLCYYSPLSKPESTDIMEIYNALENMEYSDEVTDQEPVLLSCISAFFPVEF